MWQRQHWRCLTGNTVSRRYRQVVKIGRRRAARTVRKTLSTRHVGRRKPRPKGGPLANWRLITRVLGLALVLTAGGWLVASVVTEDQPLDDAAVNFLKDDPGDETPPTRLAHWSDIELIAPAQDADERVISA